MARWRHSFPKFVPSWLSREDGEKVLFSLGYIVDAFIERTRQSLTARFPQWTDRRGVTHYAGPTALAMLGAERGIVKGRAEDTPGYTRRLREWRGERGHLVRGSAFALLRQAWAYFGGMHVQTIDYNGNLFDIADDGTETATHGNTWNWSTDDERRARFWMVLYPNAADGFVATPDWGDAALWGGEIATPGYTVGQLGVVVGDTQTMRGFFLGDHPWHMAGTLPEWLIVSMNDSAPVPNGTWARWSRRDENSTQVEARSTNHRYWSLSPTINNAPAGDPLSYAEHVTLVEGTVHDGDPMNAAAWGAVTKPDGSTYAGNPASFPATVQLLDDGDLPQ